MQTHKDFDGMKLIRTIDSERYGDYTQWKKQLSMSYVDEFVEVTGKERDRFIKRQIENTQWYWEDTLPKELDKLLEVNNRIQHSKKYINTNEAISEWLDTNNNRELILELINYISTQ